jgi:hypothetical protein
MFKAKKTKQDYNKALVDKRFFLWAYYNNIYTMENLGKVKLGRKYVLMHVEMNIDIFSRPPFKLIEPQEIRTELAIIEQQHLRLLQLEHANDH